MAEAKEGEEHRSLNELASAIAECVDRHDSLRMQCKNGQMWALVVKAISGTLPNETCVFAPFFF